MKQLHSLITNTTSLVGYIAVLMFTGAFLGGGQGHSMDIAALKGNIGEYSRSETTIGGGTQKLVIVTIDGRQYHATIL